MTKKNAEHKEREFVAQAAPIFFKYGIKSVTMDDLARHLGMSKKTIYTHVSDKNDLVNKVFLHQHQAEQTAINAICSRGLNAIDEMFEIGHFVVAMLNEVHPSIHYDLQKYHPGAFKLMLDTHHTSVYQCIADNLNKGISEGLYRSDLNVNVIARLYTHRIDTVFDAEIFPPEEVSFSDVYATMFRYHILGVASPKGIDLLDAKWKEINAPTNS